MNTPYKKYFKEAFLKSDIEKALTLTIKIISKRIGKRIYISSLPDEVVKQGSGKIAGVIATIADGRYMRFNWKLNDASGKIVSIDFWNKLKLQPDLTLDIPDVSIVKVIDAIVATLTSGEPGLYQFEEGKLKEKGESANTEIGKSIKAWATEMDVDDEKLSKTRIAHLYNDYKFWNTEVASQPFKLGSYPSFRNFIIDFMVKSNIQNIYMRKVKVTKASKEMAYVDELEKKEFDNEIYQMSLSDKMEFLKKNIMMVVNGYENALILGGSAGIGKSQSLKDILYASMSKVKVVWKEGMDFRSFGELYKFFYDNNKKDTVIVFDDITSVLSKKFLPIMNAVLAPAPKRIVSFPVGLEKSMPKGYEADFLFESKIIIVTNIPKNKIPASLVSRGAYAEIKVSPGEIIDYIRQNIDDVMKGYKQATKQIKLEVIDFLESMSKNITHIDFRIFKRIVIFRLTEDPAWKKYAVTIARGM
jgi:hypothetical protein